MIDTHPIFNITQFPGSHFFFLKFPGSPPNLEEVYLQKESRISRILRDLTELEVSMDKKDYTNVVGFNGSIQLSVILLLLLKLSTF